VLEARPSYGWRPKQMNAFPRLRRRGSIGSRLPWCPAHRGQNFPRQRRLGLHDAWPDGSFEAATVRPDRLRGSWPFERSASVIVRPRIGRGRACAVGSGFSR